MTKFHLGFDISPLQVRIGDVGNLKCIARHASISACATCCRYSAALKCNLPGNDIDSAQAAFLIAPGLIAEFLGRGREEAACRQGHGENGLPINPPEWPGVTPPILFGSYGRVP